jgi:hypothetical protein
MFPFGTDLPNSSHATGFVRHLRRQKVDVIDYHPVPFLVGSRAIRWVFIASHQVMANNLRTQFLKRECSRSLFV